MNMLFSLPRNFLALGAVALAGAIALPVLASPPAEIIKQRQETMKELGGHMKAIKAFAMEGQGSAEDVARRAAEVEQIAAKIPSLFPEGTGMDEVKEPETGAKPEIWLDWENFEKAAVSLETEAGNLQKVASNSDESTIRQAFQSLGKNGCGNCHETFRQKLEK